MSETRADLIKIILNGKEREIQTGMTVSDLLTKWKMRPELVTVEVNEDILQKLDYESTTLKSGDHVEFVFYMGGGAKVNQSILDLVGNTPMVQLLKVADKSHARIFAKLEMFNPGGSVKDRIALNMIEQAEKKGILKPGSVIVEPTSGNTGIGLAVVGAVKGYKVILTMPEAMSQERIQILESFGAEVVLTPAKDGMVGAVEKAREIVASKKDAFMPQQFTNPDNPAMHRKTTAKEILRDIDGEIDAFVAGVGTGGTITGVGEVLKKHNPKIKIVAVEPKSSAVLSGGKPGPHMIQGIGAGFVPDVLDRGVIDQILTVDDHEAYDMAKRLTREEGIFAGISSGAACLGAIRIAKALGPQKTVVTVFPDSGERYLSVEPYFNV
ncbi:MAG: cysteine synthase A [Candidatus Omnitrophota bacterium]